jgi:hypothetical protein
MMPLVVVLAGLCAAGCGSMQLPGSTRTASTRRITVEEYLDKLKGGWVGQMAGAGWGSSTEFKYVGVIMPLEAAPPWTPSMVNQFERDDLCIKMTFLRTLERHSLDVPARQAGLDFANTGYPFRHANREARNNLRAGIAPPDSGHPRFNAHPDDIDYQAESDFAGLIAPGMPAVAVQLADKFGHMIGYGDGVYGGQFVAGMYAEAFFEKDPVRIVEAGLKCIPRDSEYHRCIDDVVQWHARYPDEWMRVWQLVDQKYRLNASSRRASCTDMGDPFDTDAKLNGAYVVMGLLYGQGDPDRTIAIAMQCGQDSGCNSSTAAGVLFTSIGFRSVPEKFKVALDPWGKFAQTTYDFPTLINVCEDLARQAVVACGGQVEMDDDATERFVIPVLDPSVGSVQVSWDPGPASGSRYMEDQVAAVATPLPAGLSQVVNRFAPGWQISNCGEQTAPGLYDELRGRRNVLVTCPPNPVQGCVLSRRLQVPEGMATVLKLIVGHDPRGDWALAVTVDGKPLMQKTVGPGLTRLGWTDIRVDLSAYAGKTIDLQLINLPTGWHYEAAYWAEISLQSI